MDQKVEMNHLDRLAATIKFKKTDRPPVAGPVFGHAAHLSGLPLHRYLQSGRLLADAQISAHNHYGYDITFAFFDVNVETEAMGAVLHFREHDYPYVQQGAFSPDTDFLSLAVPDLSRAGRIPELLEGVRLLRARFANSVPVAGLVLGPFNLACQLIGMEDTLYLAVDDPKAFTALLDFATEFCIAYGIAQIEAGVHLPIIFDVSASPEIIPAGFFREFELPRLKRVFSRFKAAGAIANWLFITGDIKSILHYFPVIGVDIANFDYCVPPDAVKHSLPHTCVNGNVKPLLFEHGTPEEIDRAARELLTQFSRRKGFILSAGCEIPLRARPDTIQALVKAAAE